MHRRPNAAGVSSAAAKAGRSARNSLARSERTRQRRGDIVSDSRVDVEELKRIPVFAELNADQLAWLAYHGGVCEYEAGESVFELGHVAEHMLAVLDGAIEIVFSVGGQLVPFVTQRQGTVSGLLPFSRMRSFSGSGHAVGRTRLYRLHQSFFDEMLHVAPSLGPVLVAMMTDRVRDTTRLAQQREKMMALGKLSAGLAHELNNPVTAVRRTPRRSTNNSRPARVTDAVLRDHAPVRRRRARGVDPRGWRKVHVADGALSGGLEQDITSWLDERCRK